MRLSEIFLSSVLSFCEIRLAFKSTSVGVLSSPPRQHLNNLQEFPAKYFIFEAFVYIFNPRVR